MIGLLFLYLEAVVRVQIKIYRFQKEKPVHRKFLLELLVWH
ncbi:hypothetical Protein YC6258_03446 [Gynuella sunshinyii YC6258]|uniref:Uncharacterized protein n=1 Tax=Gynuella sunshinyii YC6258 TaxID=1445510 RepID=A0A0C5VLA1_9GAMM|nr:hypothetical Protein YC6258_03446 [Gynuella sunshinyii YC6258]